MTAGTGPAPAAGAAAAGRDRPPRAADLALRLAGGLVALAGGLLVGVLVLMSVPLRLAAWFGTVRLPVAVLVAVGGMLALLWFTPRATGARWAVVLPVAGWFAVAVAALGAGDPGGQLLPPDDWVAGLALFGGTAVAVVGMVLVMAAPAPGRRP